MTERRPNHFQFLLVLMAFVGMPCAAQSHGAGTCPNYSSFLGGPISWIYRGKFGHTPVRIMLHYDSKAKQIVGEYGFSEVRSVQTVTGQITDEGKQLQLQERDAAGRPIGNLELVFGPPKGMTNDTECTYLTGEESSRSNPIHHGVLLSRVNPVAKRFDQSRKLNEDAAFEIQQALKHNDSARFASLIHYPLYVQHMKGSSVYGSPIAVIKNYQKIVTPTRAFVMSAIPHELLTFGTSTRFADGVMCLLDGKLAEICKGGCRCPQIY